ncbi:MAG: MMPL family transporter, partial [Proteobacteria bacterium]|nr:MMPL family transporter [Pseudomonadota bacterium]
LILAVEEVGWPLVFSALTTVAALVSFLFIPLRPIRWVGLTSASLVFLACVIVLTLLPALLSFGRDGTPEAEKADARESRIQRLMGWLAGVSLRRQKLALIVLAVGMGVCLVGTSRIDVSFDVLKTFGRKVPYVDRIYSVGQSQVGSLYSYNLALEFDQPGAAKDPDNLQKFDQLVAEIDNLELTKKTTSLLQILKDLNQVMHEGDPVWYRLPESRDMVAQLLLLYENAGGDEVERWIDYDYQRLKLQVEMGHYNSGEAARELHWIREEAARLFPDAHVVLTGSISQYTVMQDYVSFGQIKSFFIAFTVVTLLLMIVFGSLRIGLIAMIPNIAPVLVVGAIMGFADIPLDLVTVTIMPMLLGLAVDDTIHFINHSQLEFERCRDYALSNRRTFLAVGGALLMTTVVLTLNFSAYMVSVVNIFVSMGFLVGAGLFAALAADFFITPVLLSMTKPFGPERRG